MSHRFASVLSQIAWVIALFLAFAGMARALAVAAPPDGASICESAARQAAREYQVPPDILAGLTLTETGRRKDGRVRPWAWSVNAEGKGSWFDTPQEALALASERVALGRLNVDIGCFQLNYRWHGEHFPSVEAMFDPLENARYAARFVRDLYAEFGDWRRAAGAFHSRTPENANRYLARFDELRAAFLARGFDGLDDAPQTYNSFQPGLPFAIAAPSPPERRVRVPAEPATILGVPLAGAQPSRGSSLVALGGRRAALLSQGAPLLSGRPRGLWTQNTADNDL